MRRCQLLIELTWHIVKILDGTKGGGRFSPPHLPKVSLILCEFFLNIFVTHYQPIIMGQIYFRRTEIHD
jgi:hypothetical protein